jgi:hypothetical protein
MNIAKQQGLLGRFQVSSACRGHDKIFFFCLLVKTMDKFDQEIHRFAFKKEYKLLSTRGEIDADY